MILYKNTSIYLFGDFETLFLTFSSSDELDELLSDEEDPDRCFFSLKTQLVEDN
jgi:hypothetical protein